MTLPVIPILDIASPTFATDIDLMFDTTIRDWGDVLEADANALTMNGFVATSATSNTLGSGAKTFTASTGKDFCSGMWITVSDAAAPSTNSMTSQITSYDTVTGQLVINTSAAGVHGTGTKSSWLIALSGDPSPTGDTTISGDLSLTNVTASGLIVSTSPSSGIGYDTGAGGAVTAISSPRATLNKICGSITLPSGTLGAGLIYFAYVNNSLLTTGDAILFSMSGTSAAAISPFNYMVTPYSAGLMEIRIRNMTLSSKSYSGIVVNFSIIKKVNA